MSDQAGRAEAVAKYHDPPFGQCAVRDPTSALGQFAHTRPGQLSEFTRTVRQFLTVSCEVAVCPETAHAVRNVRQIMGRTAVVGLRHAQLATLQPWIPVVWYVRDGDDGRAEKVDDAERAAVEHVSALQQPIVTVSASAGVAIDLLASGAEWVCKRMLERDLMAALDRARATAALAAMSRAIDTNSRIPAKLRRGLVYATRPHASIPRFGKPRLGGVERLARYVECDRSTLTTQWRLLWSRASVEWGSQTVRSDLRLEDFVHWPLLIHAVVRKTQQLNWAHIATRFGLHEDTLNRAGMRLTGRSLAQLARDGPLALCAEFFERVIEPLLASADQGVR